MYGFQPFNLSSQMLLDLTVTLPLTHPNAGSTIFYFQLSKTIAIAKM